MLWEEIVAKAGAADVPPEFVLREEAQKAILTYLSRRLFFRGGVFQGGTALRLFYGNARYSEDMDFVFIGRRHPAFAEFVATLSDLPDFLLDFFPFAARATLKIQKDSDSHKRTLVRLETPPLKRILAIRVEAVNVPSYVHTLLILPEPPFHPPVRVESREEILADKVVAVAFREFIKGRDLWDIFFLSVQRGVALRPELVAQKVSDYGHTREEFEDRLATAVRKIEQEGVRALEQEMTRFLPGSTLSLWRDHFGEAVERVCGFLGGVRSAGDPG